MLDFHPQAFAMAYVSTSSAHPSKLEWLMRRSRDKVIKKKVHSNRDSKSQGPKHSPSGFERGRNADQSVLPQSRQLKKLLEGIGTPAPQPFVPDPFQLAALEALEFEDVLVTAPTGSGKTWIAREEMRRLLETGRRG